MKDPRTIARQAAGLVRTSRAAGRAYDSSAVRAAVTARRLRRRQGYEYAEALRSGLLDPALPESERALHVSRHAGLEACAPLNHGNVVPMLNGDKSVFYRFCLAQGIPTPRLLAIIDRRGSSWGASGRIFRDRRGFEEFVVGETPGEFIVKPSLSGMGEGIRLLVKDGAELVHHDGARTTPGGLWDELMADPEFDEWIVQERMHNHPDLVAIAGAASLHSARITTIADRDGRPELLFGFLKLALSGGVSDNFLGGRTGNGLSQVSMADGRLGPLLMPDPARPGIGFRRVSHSPLTGAPVEGAVLPHWEEVRSMVLRAAPLFLPTRGLGWDIALAPSGPVALEANIRWVPLPLPTMRPVYERVAALAAVR